MTVCIAGINRSNPQSFIIAACDRKVSFFGGWASAEGVAMKISGVNKDWTVMFSGPVSPMTAIVDAIKEKAEKTKMMDMRPFAYLCRSIYREERKRLIESEILGDYDVDTYSEYVSLRKTDAQFHSEITKRIRDVEQDWSLLFAGFDKVRRAHIFTIQESGKIGFCDAHGFAAIGSGAWRALLTLSSYPFKRELPLSHSIFGIASAKFASEVADGVGKETILTILEPRTTAAPVFTELGVTRLRKMWEELPRFPKEATTNVWQELEEFQRLGWLGKNKPLKPSNYEKLQIGREE